MTSAITQLPSETNSEWEQRKKDFHNYLNLSQKFTADRNMILWLCSVHRNAVKYEKVDSSITKEIQEQLDAASNIISITYIFALMEEANFNENSKWLTDDERLELKAWKHVRHTGAHAPSSRAHRYHDEFENYMNGNSLAMSGLRQNCEWDNDSLSLKDGMNHKFFEFSENLVQKAFGHCANNNTPV